MRSLLSFFLILFLKPQVVYHYYQIIKLRRLGLEKQSRFLINEIKNFLIFSQKHSAFHRSRFAKYGFDPYKFDALNQLEQLPIMTKEEIINNYSDIAIKNGSKAISCSTGGSTGEPMKYQVSVKNNNASLASLFAGWQRAGYRIGDKVFIFAGGSLTNAKASVFKRLKLFILNFSVHSSYGVNEAGFDALVKIIDKERPKFLRGYVSSIVALSEYVLINKVQINFKIEGVFTTSEMLTKKDRTTISNAFQCPVFNTYGLNDGALTAYECKEHDGLHIDEYRGYMEFLRISGGSCKLLATNFIDYSFPLIRYDTNDLGILSEEICPCGESGRVLKNILGRATDTLEVNGKVIGSPVLTVLMGKTNAKKYRFVQTKAGTLKIYIVKGHGWENKDEELIRCSLKSALGDVALDFFYIPSFDYQDGKKHKFIMRE